MTPYRSPVQREYDRLYPRTDLQERQMRVADGMARRTQSPEFARRIWVQTRTWITEAMVLGAILVLVLAFYVAW